MIAYIPLIQARFRTSNNKIIEATCRSDTGTLKEIQS